MERQKPLIGRLYLQDNRWVFEVSPGHKNVGALYEVNESMSQMTGSDFGLCIGRDENKLVEALILPPQYGLPSQVAVQKIFLH